MEDISPMRFCYMFVEFFENHGIFDEFDAEQNRMVPSQGVKNLYEIAKEILPERVSNTEAAERMRDLSEDEREFMIGEEEEGVVVDMRDYFAEEVQRNGGARGLLFQLELARNTGDKARETEIWNMIEQFNERGD